MGGPFKLKGMDFGNNSPMRQEKVFKGRTDILEKPTAGGPYEDRKNVEKSNKISNIESKIGDVKEAVFNEEISKEKADAKIALLKKKLALLK